MIILYIQDELSFDDYHEKADRIYRISTHSKIGDNERHWSLVPSSVAPALLSHLPAIEMQARIATLSKANQVVKYGDQLYDESIGKGAYGRVFFADSTFLDVFSFELSGAHGTDALNKPNTVVITRSVANKIFKDRDPIGERLEFSNLGDYEVTAVIEKVPSNSHLQFDYLLSTDFTGSNSPGRFFWVRSYIVMSPGTDVKEVESQLDTIGRAAQPSLTENGIHMDYFLQSVKDIHLTSGLEYEVYPTSDIRYVYIFLAISSFILIIATINFINLSTAQIGKRSKEVGIRKVMGAANRQMLLQFFVQSVLVSVIALAIALILIVLTIDFFNQFTDKQLTLVTLLSPTAVVTIVGVVVLIGMVAGFYPAIIMNRFSPILAIKENLSPGSSSQLLKKLLVIFQFCISVILIVSTYTIVQQLYFLRSKGLGFDPKQIVTLPIDGNLSYDRLNTLKNEMQQISGVNQVTLSTGAPGLNMNVMVMLPEGFDQSNTQRVDGVYADFDFLKAYSIDLLAGRDYDTSLASDSLNFIINKSAVEKFGWTVDEAVGKEIHYLGNGPITGKSGYVIGVMDDFHYQTLHNVIGPLMLGIHSSNFNVIPFSHMSIKVNSTDVHEIVKGIESIWQTLNAETPFSYAFLNETFYAKYDREERLSQIISAFAVLAVAIACLGLLGLASFIVQQKTKEIGIRKVLGATVANIWSKLSGSLIVLIIIGNIIAWPVAYYFLDQWLEGFAYRIDIRVWIFLLAGLSSVFVALITIGFKTIKASMANPIDSIRYE